MRYSQQLSKEYKVAGALGLLALSANVLSGLVAGPGSTPDFGNVFIFMAAGALSPLAALTSALLATGGEVVLMPERLDIARLIFLALGSALLLRSFPRLPLFGAVGLLWLLALSPTIVAGAAAHTRLSWANQPLMLIGMWDVLLSVAAGLALINSSVWAVITGKPRHTSLHSVLAHSIAAAALFPMIGAVLIFDLDSWIGSPVTAGNLLLLVSLSLLLPIWLGDRIVLLVGSRENQLLHSNHGPERRFRTLSQLASEMWQGRRELWKQNSERSLSELERTRSRAILSSSQGKDVGICALSRDGTIAFTNERFCEIAGISLRDNLGRRFDQVSMDRRIQKAVQDLVQESFSKGTGRQVELRLNQFPERLQFLRISSELPQQRDSQDAQSVIVTLADISSKRTVGYDLILEQRKESIRSLVAGMCHAFNNTLTSVAGYASAARKSEDPFALDRCLEQIVEATKHAGSLVHQLMDFADLKRCGTHHERLDKLLRDQSSVLAKVAGEPFQVHLAITDRPCMIEGDSTLLMQAVTNLILHARDSYSSAQGEIWVSVDVETFAEESLHALPGARAGTFARVQVRDRGQGMGAEVLRQVLDPERYQNGAATQAGLPLVTAYAIARAHDGFVLAESHPDKGTTISLYFPLVALPTPTANPQSQTAPAETPVPNRAPFEILVVEDDKNIREVVSAMLSTLGYQVTTCNNGEEAISKCAERSFDLVLVDLVMPKMHGLEVIERLRSSHPTMRTLLMTGSGHIPSGDSQPSAMIPKPFDLDALDLAIRTSMAPNTH